MVDFFIVGASKAGTTTLWNMLKQHPEIFMPEGIAIKEPCYFVNNYGVKSLGEYLSIFPANNDLMIGEASTVYLSSPESPTRIHTFNPRAKIIIILRNPADRAYSLYRWMVQEGYEWISSFEQAVAYEKTRQKRKIPNFWEFVFKQDYLYFSSGLYFQQVKRYLELFGNNVKIYLFEDFIKAPSVVLCDCQKFLGVKEIELTMEHKNSSKNIFSPKLAFGLKFIDRLTSKFVPNLSTKKFVRLALSKSLPPKLIPSFKQKLLKQYDPDIRLLESLLQRNLSLWRNC